MNVNPGILLLERFSELYELERDVTKWSITNFKKNLPRLIRLQMILSLFKVLGIKRNFKSFMEGGFIQKDYDVNNLLQLLLLSDEDIEQVYDWISNGYIKRVTDEFSKWEAMFTFKYLLKYRLQLELLYRCHAGNILCSPRLFLAAAIKNHIEENIINQTKLLSKVLVHFINPTDMEITMASLHSLYNYPIEDLGDIDFEWM
jgi:hypothetical protein